MGTTRHQGIKAALLFGFFALGCGGQINTGGRMSSSQFPSRAELTALTASPPPAKIKVGNDVDVGTWSLSGPLPDAIDSAPEDASTPWGKALSDAAAKRSGVVLPTRAMECAARESASFLLEHNALPGRGVRRFIAGRCGVPTSYLRVASVAVGNIPAGTSDDVVWNAMREDVSSLMEGLGTGLSFAGLGFARKGDRASVVLSVAERMVRLDSTPLVPGDAFVVLRGELLRPAHSVRALVTAGSFGFQECIQDPAAALPRFAIACPVTRTDPSVTIELVGFPAGRLLGETMLEAVVFPAAPSLAFNGSTADDATFPGDKAAIVMALAEQVNRVRGSAGMPPLRLSPGQSSVAASLAPYYFAAVTGALDPMIADKVALGIMAGWDVEGDVRDGHFSSGVYGHRDPARLLEELAARPFGRETLFDPKAGALAVGVLAPSDGALGAVIGTYALFNPATRPDEEMGQVVDRLTRLRYARGLPPPRLITQLDQDARRAAAEVNRGVDPSDALDEMTQATASRLSSGGVRAWTITAPSIAALEFPPELLTTPNLPIAVAVVHHRPAGHPWRQIMVFVVTLQMQGLRTAKALGPRGG